MSKQRRNQQGHQHQKTSEQGLQHQSEQSRLGNAAMQQRVSRVESATASAGPTPESMARMLRRGALALHLEATPEHGQFIDILERSNLPASQRMALVDRLEADRDASEAVSESMERWFGADTESLRSSLIAILDGAAVAIAEAQSTDLEAHLNGLDEAVEAGEATSLGEAVRGLCADLFLALHWHDEEEEEDGWVPSEEP